jgi:uncharacterized metal-binding protein/rhodanese-related sulfurtransferase
MNCLGCTSKACKRNGKDCLGIKEDIIREYRKEENSTVYHNADNLVSDGKAGRFSRAEELVMYCKDADYTHIALAYCYGLEEVTKSVKEYLVSHGFTVLSFRCTINGIKENDVIPDLRDTVNCNPIGQAMAIYKSKAQIVVVIGLCLGHDILFHHYISLPCTTLIVKDRVYNHNPLAFFQREKSGAGDPGIKDSRIEEFLHHLDNQFNLKSGDWLFSMIEEGKELCILDLRLEEDFEKDHIPGSIRVSLRELPEKKDLLPENKSIPVIALCNGGIQSAYAIAYLYTLGYHHVYHLSGGYKSWQKRASQ